MTKKKSELPQAPNYWVPPSVAQINEMTPEPGTEGRMYADAWIPKLATDEQQLRSDDLDTLVSVLPSEHGALVIEVEDGDEFVYVGRIPADGMLKWMFAMFARWLVPVDCQNLSELAAILEVAFRQWGQFYYTQQGKIPIDPPSYMLRKFLDGWKALLRYEYEQPGGEGDSPPEMEPK